MSLWLLIASSFGIVAQNTFNDSPATNRGRPLHIHWLLTALVISLFLILIQNAVAFLRFVHRIHWDFTKRPAGWVSSCHQILLKLESFQMSHHLLRVVPFELKLPSFLFSFVVSDWRQFNFLIFGLKVGQHLHGIFQPGLVLIARSMRDSSLDWTGRTERQFVIRGCIFLLQVSISGALDTRHSRRDTLFDSHRVDSEFANFCTFQFCLLFSTLESFFNKLIILNFLQNFELGIHGSLFGTEASWGLLGAFWRLCCRFILIWVQFCD